MIRFQNQNLSRVIVTLIILVGRSQIAKGELLAVQNTSTPRQHLLESTTLTTSQSATSSFVGNLDLRPSYQPDSGRAFSYNLAELGYRFSPNFTLSYQQFFYTYFSNVPNTANNVQAFDGVIHASLRHLYDSPDRSFTVGDDIEIILPTDPYKRNAGMIGAVRNTFIFEQTLSPSLVLSLKDAPIVYGFQQQGGMLPINDGDNLGLSANPIFENLASIGLSYRFGRSGWSLNVPVYLDSTRYYDFNALATNNDNWTEISFIYPELIYTTSSNLSLGVGYQSGNLINFTSANGDESDVGTGTFRFIIKAKF